MALCRGWLNYLNRGVFPGGCFFAAASFEFDGRPGPVRDAIAVAMNDWLATLEKSVRLAKEEGHLDPHADPAQIAFELNALFLGANFSSQLQHDPLAFRHAEKAIEQRLESLRVRASRTRARARRKSA